jgi:elongator complex protein 2
MHTDSVNAVKFFRWDDSKTPMIISGSADKTIRGWVSNVSGVALKFEPCFKLESHESSITSLAVLAGSNMFVSAAADSRVNIWKVEVPSESGQHCQALLLQDIRLKLMPLAVSVCRLDSSSIILAVAGSKSTIEIYVSSGEDPFASVATLAGHSGWIRSLSFVNETTEESSDLLLASASQDKFIRLWRVHKGTDIPSSNQAEDVSLGVVGRSVSTKAHRFLANHDDYTTTFEALLLGHDDWIYTTSWQRHNGTLQLLSASADSSLAIWETDRSSGIWVCISRLGEISAQKGSTTATGSAGGFWIGLWSPDAHTVVSLGRTGSWRLWKRTPSGTWKQDVGVGGHIRSVTGITWSRNGDYLLSTSLDQTTRLHAEWKQESTSTWHEFSRPQIHGYDLNCMDLVSDTQFVSGADEKPLRVFQEPVAVANILQRLCGIHINTENPLPDAANIPVLSLSNKAIQVVDDTTPTTGAGDDAEAADPASILHKSAIEMDHPPLEDQLARHLLWPEIQKMYGHGYETSAVSVTMDGTLMATACRASSIDHAVIRVYETKEWREICAPLRAHSLTVTNLQWSPDGRYLLSVGRDRTWSVFELNGVEFTATTSKGHSRMILGCSWAPVEAGRIFATAGRDKSVKLWQQNNEHAFELKDTIQLEEAVTAVAFLPLIHDGKLWLAAGLESGDVAIFFMTNNHLENRTVRHVKRHSSPRKTINRLAWRPSREGPQGCSYQLAVASEDASLRIYSIHSM